MKKICTFLALSALFTSVNAQDGNLDSTFGINGLSVIRNIGDRSDFPVTMFITSDGKNVQVANAATDSNTHYLLVRRNENGTLDQHFGVNGVALADIDGRDGNAFSGVELPGGKYMIAGNCLKKNFSKYTMILMRFNNNGTVDSTFGDQGNVSYSIGDDYSNDYPTALLVQKDGRLIATGYTSVSGQYVLFAARYLPDGRRDTSFGNAGKKLIPLSSYSLFGNNGALQDDGKVLIIASVQNADYQFDFATVRLNADGSLDNTFGRNGKVITDFGGNNDFPYGIAIQPDHKILVGGYYNAGNKANTGIIRYNPDGSVDATFGNKGKTAAALPNASVDCFSIALQPDNKIVAGATAYYLNGTNSDYALFRFQSNGKPDLGFGSNGKVITSVTDGFDAVNVVRTNAKGKILVAGSSQSKLGISKLSEARYVTSYQLSLASANSSVADMSTTTATGTLIVYPNPAKDYINLKADWVPNENVKVTVYNQEGKVMLTGKYAMNAKNEIVKIYLDPSWKAGTYYIKIEGSNVWKSSFNILK